MKLFRALGPMTLSTALLTAAIGTAVICAAPLSGQEASGRLGLEAAVATLQDGDWTAVTIASDGSWGVATEITVGGALARAIANCKVMSKGQIGCGAQARTIRAGWIVGMHCGDRSIIAAGARIADAERAARSREAELKQFYVPEMPACRQVVAAGPGGVVATTMSAAGGPS